MATNEQPLKPTIDRKTHLAGYNLEDIRGDIPMLSVPELLVRCSGTIAGRHHTWVLYIPRCWNPKNSVPLVVGLHGGGTSGEVFAARTVFPQIAEKENVILLFPDATLRYEDEEGVHHEWNSFYLNNKAEDETVWLKELIENVCVEYNIDRSRIYLFGHSNGDAMSCQLAVTHADMFAAYAGLNGPFPPEQMRTMSGEPLRPEVALPHLRWHGERDPLNGGAELTRRELHDAVIQFWRTHNDCCEQPLFRLDGKLGTAIYRSKSNAEVRFTEYKGGPHSLNLEAAGVVWYEFFCKYARGSDGSVLLRDIPDLAPPDRNAVALARGKTSVLVKNENVKVDEYDPDTAIIEVSGDLWVPSRLFARLFSVEIHPGPDLESAQFTCSGHTAVVRADHPVLWIDHRIVPFRTNPQKRCGDLWFSIQEVAEQLLGKQVSKTDGVMYISDRYQEIGTEISRMIQEII